ncbi:TerC family protein [Pseudomonas sp. KNUC1026]|nr:TerC family protein [Pseudomonas sp. KNUC1026]UFH50257.1 TerC family protein [Pseudomonas sp. KNUC1026]
MEWIADPTAWLGLLTLIVLELVLGIDNLVFIAILADKLPPHQRDRARVIGLSLALIMRLGLLASISWMVTLTRPLFEVFGQGFSGRDLILLFGGVFLLFKATMELHERLEGHAANRQAGAGYAAFWPIVAQIVVLDAVFSLDAVITAVGMVEHLAVMMIAVMISIGLMIVASKPLTRFVNAHPTVIMLCLGFLLMIGFSLTAEGLGFHIPKGYLYAAIGFSLLLEAFNQLARHRRRKSLRGNQPMRERTAHAVLRLLGGKPLDESEVGHDVADLVDEPSQASGEAAPMFGRRERVMISAVLQLAQRPIRTAMTPRTDVASLSDTRPLTCSTKCWPIPRIRGWCWWSPASRMPLGYVRKQEVLCELLAGREPNLPALAHQPLHLLETFDLLNALEQMRARSAHIAFVVNEFGDFTGLLTLTDVLEAITGELPDASDRNGPALAAEEGGWLASGTLSLAYLAERSGFQAPASDDYQTVGGLMMSLLDRLPVVGDEVECGTWQLRVHSVEERRVKTLHLRKRV